MRHRGGFPWHTLTGLLLVSYTLALLLILWWRGWTAIFPDRFPGEHWLDFALLHGGAGYTGWRWLVLGKALWERWR